VSGGDSEISLLYSSVAGNGSEPLSGFGRHFLQIGQLRFPESGSWDLRIFSPAYQRAFQVKVDASQLAGVLLSLPAGGEYRIDAVGEVSNGHIESDSAGYVFLVEGFSFVTEAHFVEGKSPADDNKGKATSIGVVVGIAVGGVVLVVAAIIVVVALFVRARRLGDASVATIATSQPMLYGSVSTV
jgi:hypothetical protein